MKRSRRYILCGAVAALLVLITYIFGMIPVEDTQGDENTDYKGIITLYDIATPTVLGNDFSVISTVCEEFSRRLDFSFVRLNKINSITPQETYLSLQGNADIIRFDETLTDRTRIMNDIDFTSRMGKSYENIPLPSDNGMMVVPYWYDVYIVIINTDILEEYDIRLRGDIDKQILMNIISVCGEKGLMYADESCRKLLSDEKYSCYIPSVYDKFTAGTCVEFAQGSAAVYLGTLKDVAFLKGRDEKGKEVCEYKFFPYPSENGELFVSEISYYAFMQCEDERKKAVLTEFAEYLHSYEAMQYTENLGMLPWVLHEGMTYEKYPYLKAFAYYEGIRVPVMYE